MHLEIHPELGGSTEVPGEPDGRAGCDPALAVHDLVDPARRHPDGGGEAALRDPEALDEVLHEDLSRVDRLDEVSVS